MNWWDSFLTAASTVLIFIFVIGMGFLAVCSLFDDRIDGPLKKIRPFARFIISSIFMMLVCFGLFLWLALGFPEHLNPTDPPPTTGEEVLNHVCMVAMWPLSVGSLIFRGDPPLMPLWFLPIGLFWGIVVEMFFILLGRKAPQALQTSN